jgi:hypothetical protein
MWHTPKGDRVLRGAEWDLFRDGMGILRDEIEMSLEFDDDDPFEIGIPLFDQLQPGQKLAMLALVGRALHSEEVAPPQHTAYNEATVAAVFAHNRSSVTSEIELADESVNDETTAWRRQILLAYKEVVPEAVGKRATPSPTSSKLDAWELLIEILEGTILWDADYEEAAIFMDTPPEERDDLRKCMGISDDYFLDIAPDPTDAELEDVRRSLTELIHGAKT